MKISIPLCLSFIIMTMIISCEKSTKESIVYRKVEKEYVLIRDAQALKESNDETSRYADSIMTGLIHAEFVSTGIKSFDLTGNSYLDIGFEIIDLHQFNPNKLPDSFDTLAARVIPISVEVLDNSTWGYADALDLDDPIHKDGNWSPQSCVLGTFMNAGRFNGQGEKYLGIRFPEGENFKYGWIKIYCSLHNDTLRIIDYAYNDIANGPIKAGQEK
jgi:hypothetical protein